MSKRVTIKDIARLAGTSHPVVLAALGRPSGTAKVSPETQKRILKIVKDLNFVPNLAAGQLARGKSRLIGVVTSSCVSGLSAGLQFIAMRECYANGFDVLAVPGGHPENDAEARNLLEIFRMRNVEGILSLAPSLRLREHAAEYEIPFVGIGRDFANPHVSDLAFDTEQGEYLAASHLIRHGRRNLVFLSGESVTLPTGSSPLKFAGMMRALREVGQDCPESRALNVTACSAEETLEKLLRLGADGVLTCNDFCAASFIRAAFRHGVRIPEDIAVVGYDGYSFCDILPLSLATVRQPQKELAHRGVQLLLERIAGSAAMQSTILIPPLFRPGESCGCQLQHDAQIMTVDGLYLENFTVDASFAVEDTNVENKQSTAEGALHWRIH